MVPSKKIIEMYLAKVAYVITHFDQPQERGQSIDQTYKVQKSLSSIYKSGA